MNMTNEPARIIGYVTTAVTAIIGVLIAFGVNISDQQQTAILTAIGAFVPVAIFMTEFIRSRVVSPASAGEAVAVAKTASPFDQVGLPDSNTVPDIKVANYKDAVIENLPATVDERTISWKPKIANP